MKKNLHYAIVFLLLLVTSCATDKFEIEETSKSNSENVWAYDGDNTVLKGVIQELKEGTNRISLERRLLKNDVLWENAEPLIIEDKKRILVPFLSIDKENIIGFFALYRDSKGKIQYDMTVRSDVYNKKIKLPFWNSSIWAGYFTAYDRSILGKRNGNPGVMRKAIPKEQLNAMASRFETSCYNVPYESCVTVGDECYNDYTGEWTSCGGSSSSYCTTYYKFECFTYWVDDEPTPDPGSGDGGSGGDTGTGDDGDNPLQIFNYLTDKPLCIYNKLNSSSTGFANAIKKFDGKFPVSHLQLQNSSTLPSKINAQTYPPNNYIIKIEINTNNLSRPNLSIARTIIHEVIHAEMYRKILSILNNGGDLNGLTEAQWEEKLSNGDYPGIFDYYSRFGEAGMDHELMAAHYRTVISDFLKELEPGLSQDIYDALAWEGLKGTTSWNSLSSDQRNIINNTISNFNNRGSESCIN